MMKATLFALRLSELLELFADKSVSCNHEILDETNTLSQIFSRNRVWSRMAGDGPPGSVSNITSLFGDLVEFTTSFSWIVVVSSPAFRHIDIQVLKKDCLDPISAWRMKELQVVLEGRLVELNQMVLL